MIVAPDATASQTNGTQLAPGASGTQHACACAQTLGETAPRRRPRPTFFVLHSAHAGPPALHRPPGLHPLPPHRSSHREPGEPSPSESDATSSKPSGRNQSPTSAGASWPSHPFSPPSWTRPPRTRPSPASACGGRSSPWSPTPDAGRFRTRTVHRSSANACQFRSAGQQNRLASGAIRESQHRRHHRETLRKTQPRHAANRDRPGEQRQTVAVSCLHLVPTALRWIPPYFKYGGSFQKVLIKHGLE